MPCVEWLHPLDQPFSTVRAQAWIVNALRSGSFKRFRLVMAYAKEGELLRLAADLSAFRAAGGTVKAILGVDQQGTSIQALRFALANFDRTWIWQHPSRSVTFHPKQFLFEGATSAEAHVGSCNLTVGGLETNAESGVRLQYTLPAEATGWAEAMRGWRDLRSPHANLQQLNLTLIDWLASQGMLHDESVLSGANGGSRQPKTRAVHSPFPSTPYRPPVPRPPGAAATPTTGSGQQRPSPGRAAVPVAVPRPGYAPTSLPRALLIQVNPHHNGEVFLSKRAVDQHPGFFGYPFTGLTSPKRNNPPYPQRVPDPITDWTVYDKNGVPQYVRANFPLNTVFYAAKGEIRVTVEPGLRQAIVPFSILQMTRTDTPPPDYTCEVFPPNSPQFAQLIRACNESMPSGGGTVRRFGWL